VANVSLKRKRLKQRKWLRQQLKDFYAAGFEALVKRRDKCIIQNYWVFGLCPSSPPTSAEVKKTWIYTSTPPYVFMA
jgi:hypothetical protein